jgi:hypothetical protein
MFVRASIPRGKLRAGSLLRPIDASARGMDRWHDLVDWVGGYPFETARPSEIIEFYAARGFHVLRTVHARGGGCNEFVFLKSASGCLPGRPSIAA